MDGEVPGDIGFRRHLAYFSPLPPIASGVADYSWDLLPELAQIYDLTLFVPDPDRVAEEVDQDFDVQPAAAYPARRFDYDLPLYQIGNSIHHEYVYRFATRYPGIVVLHDYFLGHLIAQIYGDDRSYGNYVRELGYRSGQEGVEMAWEIRYGRQPYPLFSLPLNDRLLDRSLGFIVHSKTVARLIQNRHKPRDVGIVPQLMAPSIGDSLRDRLPASLNVKKESILFASIGHVTVNKRMDLALRAFTRVLAKHPDSRYLIIGEAAPDVDINSLIHDLGLKDVVHWTGYVAGLEMFIRWLSTADVVINLRQPTLGETSAAVLRAMAVGKPVVVFDHGWYGELPGEACCQVPPGDEEALYQALSSLSGNPDLRERIGQQALATIEQSFNPTDCAQRYSAFIEGVIANLKSKHGGADSKMPAGKIER